MPGTVLLINGDDDSREVLRLALEWKGYTVVECEDVDEGLTKARTEPPLAIVTEFLVPYRGGRCVIEELRSHSATVTVPTIVFTSDATPEAKRRIEAAHGLHLLKPVSLQVVLDIVERLSVTAPL